MSTEKKPFQLNFHNEHKIVSVTLTNLDDVFKIAHAFSKWLTENDIPNTLTENEILNAIQEVQDSGNQAESE